MSASPKILAELVTIRRALASAGVPMASPYWQSRAEAFYLHPTALLDVEEVGRGGAKTKSAIEQTIAEGLAGDFVIPPGERHYFVHVSENVTEANKTMAILQQYLRILGVRFETREGAVELLDRPIGWRVLACRVGAVSGFRCIGWTADEAAKWSNDGVNPAEEVIASIRAMSVTHPNARGRVISSPLGKVGTFYELARQGDTEAQTFGHAPSWVANPSITEAHTRTLAPHKVWLREYLAEPQEGATAALDGDLCRACLRPFRPGHALGAPFLGADLSQGKRDSTAWLVGQWVQPVLTDLDVYEYTEVEPGSWVAATGPGGVPTRRNPPPPEPRPELRITNVTSAGAWFRDGLGDLEDVFDAIASTARNVGASVVFADGYMGEAARASMARRKPPVRWDYGEWNPGTIEDQFAILRAWLESGTLAIENTRMGRELVAEMIGLSEIIRPSGGLSFSGRRGSKDDIAAALRSIAQAQAELRLTGSPIRQRSRSVMTQNDRGEWVER